MEGEDDLRFWRRWCHRNCELVEGEGKPNVAGCISRLDARQFAGALGVVDSDYDTLLGLSSPSPNLRETDAHDLECLLCRSSALDAVLVEYGSPSKIERFENKVCLDVRSGLLDKALVFGRLRWAAMRHEDTQGLSAVTISRFVDVAIWVVNGDELIRPVPNSSMDWARTWSHRIGELPDADPWYVARGHDMIEILRIGLQRVLGDISPSVGTNDLARALRLAIPRDDLQATKLWTDMRNWDAANSPYTVLIG